MKKTITIHVSRKFYALASGYAAFFDQSIEDYVIQSVLVTLQADAEANHHDDLPESRIHNEPLTSPAEHARPA
jgi:hypothetical protein